MSLCSEPCRQCCTNNESHTSKPAWYIFQLSANATGILIIGTTGIRKENVRGGKWVKWHSMMRLGWHLHAQRFVNQLQKVHRLLQRTEHNIPGYDTPFGLRNEIGNPYKEEECQRCNWCKHCYNRTPAHRTDWSTLQRTVCLTGSANLTQTQKANTFVPTCVWGSLCRNQTEEQGAWAVRSEPCPTNPKPT